MYLNVTLGKCFHLEHPFANKVSLQSMHAKRLGLTNGETFIARIHIIVSTKSGSRGIIFLRGIVSPIGITMVSTIIRARLMRAWCGWLVVMTRTALIVRRILSSPRRQRHRTRGSLMGLGLHRLAAAAIFVLSKWQWWACWVVFVALLVSIASRMLLFLICGNIFSILSTQCHRYRSGSYQFTVLIEIAFHKEGRRIQNRVTSISLQSRSQWMTLTRQSTKLNKSKKQQATEAKSLCWWSIMLVRRL